MQGATQRSRSRSTDEAQKAVMAMNGLATWPRSWARVSSPGAASGPLSAAIRELRRLPISTHHFHLSCLHALASSFPLLILPRRPQYVHHTHARPAPGRQCLSAFVWLQRHWQDGHVRLVPRAVSTGRPHRQLSVPRIAYDFKPKSALLHSCRVGGLQPGEHMRQHSLCLVSCLACSLLGCRMKPSQHICNNTMA